MVSMGVAQPQKDYTAVPRELTPAERAIHGVWVRAAGYDCASAYAGKYIIGGGALLSCLGTDQQHYLYKIQNRDGNWSISFEGVQTEN